MALSRFCLTAEFVVLIARSPQFAKTTNNLSRRIGCFTPASVLLAGIPQRNNKDIYNGSTQTVSQESLRPVTRSMSLNLTNGQWGKNNRTNSFTTEKQRTILESPITLISYRTYVTPGKKPTIESFARSDAQLGIEVKKQVDNKPIVPKLDAATRKERFKIIIKDYGKTIIVFHIFISLISLGVSYALISSNVNMQPLIEYLVGKDSFNRVMAESSTFLIAYGVHKVFAPFRLATTMAVAPPLVRYLRRKGILKHPQIKPKSPVK